MKTLKERIEDMPADMIDNEMSMLPLFSEQPLTDDIVERCVRLGRQHRMRLPDAIIAATALQMGLPLIIRNTEVFQAIAGLELINPFEQAYSRESM